MRAGPPYIPTQYSGSVTATFDFESFYFGCELGTVETGASVPLSCNVTVTGSKATAEIAQESFFFSVETSQALAPMIKAELSEKIKGLDTVTFSSEYESGQDIGATLLDNLSYTTYNAPTKGQGCTGECWYLHALRSMRGLSRRRKVLRTNVVPRIAPERTIDLANNSDQLTSSYFPVRSASWCLYLSKLTSGSISAQPSTLR